MRPEAHSIVTLLEAGQPVVRFPGDDWPWTWVRLVQYVKQVRSVYERAAYAADPKTALPPRWMWFNNDKLDDWFEQHRE